MVVNGFQINGGSYLLNKKVKESLESIKNKIHENVEEFGDEGRPDICEWLLRNGVDAQTSEQANNIVSFAFDVLLGKMCRIEQDIDSLITIITMEE